MFLGRSGFCLVWIAFSTFAISFQSTPLGDGSGSLTRSSSPVGSVAIRSCLYAQPRKLARLTCLRDRVEADTLERV